jgi:dinuclear metal center YbgI/SA1388 family protein
MLCAITEISDGSLRSVSLKLADLVRIFEDRYDPAWAEAWDAVGLVCGDPAADVGRVLFAVDPVAAVVDEALEWGAGLIVTHHPLFLRPVHGVPATTPKGRLVHRLITGGVALFTAHTNADVADPGVSDALARAVGLTGPLRPLSPSADDPRRGLGRVGELTEPVTLREFSARAADGLPVTAGGLRVAGDPDALVRTVAVCGGAGDSLLGAARAAGADVYLTADLRHHPASEFREAGEEDGNDGEDGPGHRDDQGGRAGTALIDAAHWATEWPWLGHAARLVGDTGVETRISTAVTDAWTFRSIKGNEEHT